MSDLHDISDLRPAPRTASPLVLWVLCAVALGGVSLLHEGASQMPAVPFASTTAAANGAGDVGSGQRSPRIRRLRPPQAD